MKNKTLQSLIILVIIIVAIVGLFLWSKKSSELAIKKGGTGIDTSSNSPLITIAPGMVSIATSSTIYKVTGSYPQFQQTDSSFNETIANAFMSDVSQFEVSANADYASRQKIMSPSELQNFYGNDPVYTFDLSSTIVQSNENYISVVLRENEFTGGAHPFTNIITYNYDVSAQKEMTLSDLISLHDASSAAKATLSPRLAAAANETTLDDNTNSMLQDGTDPTNADNFSNFTFTPNSITIYFASAQVAPDVFGEQDVMIPIK